MCRSAYFRSSRHARRGYSSLRCSKAILVRALSAHAFCPLQRFCECEKLPTASPPGTRGLVASFVTSPDSDGGNKECFAINKKKCPRAKNVNNVVGSYHNNEKITAEDARTADAGKSPSSRSTAARWRPHDRPLSALRIPPNYKTAMILSPPIGTRLHVLGERGADLPGILRTKGAWEPGHGGSRVRAGRVGSKRWKCIALHGFVVYEAFASSCFAAFAPEHKATAD